MVVTLFLFVATLIHLFFIRRSITLKFVLYTSLIFVSIVFLEKFNIINETTMKVILLIFVFFIWVIEILKYPTDKDLK